MKLVKIKSMIAGVTLLLFTVAVLTPRIAEAKKHNFLSSTIVPAARGYVKVKMDQNNNYGIKLSIRNLAEVERLETNKESYVVWLVTEEGVSRNLGLLNSSGNWRNKKLKADFKTASASKPTKIFITAETDPATLSPSYQTIISTANF